MSVRRSPRVRGTHHGHDTFRKCRSPPTPRRTVSTRSTLRKVRDIARVGANFQADIPDFEPGTPFVDRICEEVLWIPDGDSGNVDKLSDSLELRRGRTKFVHDERLLLALYTTNYDIRRAAKLFHAIEEANPPDRTITLPRKRIAEEELIIFGRGVRRFRKNFFEIRRRLLHRFTMDDSEQKARESDLEDGEIRDEPEAAVAVEQKPKRKRFTMWCRDESANKRLHFDPIHDQPYDVPDDELEPRLQLLVERQRNEQENMIKRREQIKMLQSAIEIQERAVEGMKPADAPRLPELCPLSPEAREFPTPEVRPVQDMSTAGGAVEYPEPVTPVPAQFMVPPPHLTPPFNPMGRPPMRYGYPGHFSPFHGPQHHMAHRRMAMNGIRGFPIGHRNGFGNARGNYHGYRQGLGRSHYVPRGRGQNS
ncbi:hypothetical protein QR680_018402 [Steinernema hermaphroditum]|uniref:Uncharacterized protein n=1 Tax=Steinernema hermaphroditum TaxID=289476 RepID=A0AA39HHV0_9BILA|nr:hypothetical protein QR680_018402 [Steinernema hermaphroditum]